MGQNILDLSNIESKDLIKELENRGYKTDLVYNIEDIGLQLDYLNGDRSDDDHIKLTESEKEQVLDDVFDRLDYYFEQINSDIQDKILEYV